MNRIKLWIIFALLPWLSLLGGCSTIQNVLGTCEIPAEYDYVAPGPVDLPDGISGKAFVKAEADERHAHGQLAKDFNGLHDHVKGCQ